MENPCVGEYTKGVSKGREYWENLRKRINRERADPKVIAQDFVFGLLQETNTNFLRAIGGKQLLNGFDAVRERGKFVTVGKNLSDLGNLVKK